MPRLWRHCARLPASPGVRRLAGEARTSRTVQTLQSKPTAKGISLYVFRPHNPFRIHAQAAIRPTKHQRCSLIALQLPVQPGHGDAAEFSAIRLPISTTMPHSLFIGAERWDFGEVIEIGLRVLERDVPGIATDVSHGNVNRFQVLLTKSFPTAQVRRLAKEPAVPDHGSADT